MRDRRRRPRVELLPPRSSPTCIPTAASRRSAARRRCCASATSSAARACITAEAADAAVATMRRFRLLAEAAGRDRDPRVRDERAADRGQRRRGPRPHRGRGRRRGRRDQRARGGPPDLHRDPGRGDDRPAPGACASTSAAAASRSWSATSPACVGRRASGSASPASPPSSCGPTRSTKADRRRLRKHVVDVLGPLRRRGRAARTRRWRSAAAARSRTSAT